MRHALLSALALLAACGGGTPTSTQPPPPPPGGTDPASLAIQAGNSQQAEPGAAVSVKPVVAVKDGTGRGVAGVTVTFTVDSGGGSLQATSAVTASDGTASPGDWHLGSAEGRNVMTAVSGTLPKVKFVATALLATRTVATQSIGTGGGTIAITTGALAGTALVIPAGAFPGAGSWQFEQKSNSIWAPTAHVTPVGAVLHITSGDTGTANTEMLLTMPGTAPTDSKIFVLIRNPANGATEVLPTVSVDPGSITVAVRSFDASRIASSASGAGLRSPPGTATMRTSGYDAEVVVARIAVTDLEGDVDTGFRPATDSWEFTSFPAALSGPLVSTGFGAVLAELAWYEKLRSGGSLNGKFQQVPQVDGSNRVGLRLSAYLTTHAPTDNIFASVKTIRNSTRAGQADQQFYDVLKANLIVSHLPQLMLVSVDEEWIPLAAFRVVSGTIHATNPYLPGGINFIDFAHGQFLFPMIQGPEGGRLVTPDWIGTTPVGQWVDMSAVAQTVTAFTTGASPDSPADWPATTVNARGGFVDDTLIYLVDDTTRYWVECATCTQGVASTLPSGKVEPFRSYFQKDDGTWAYFNGLGSIGKLLSEPNGVDTRLGFVIFESPDGQTGAWLDFRWLRAKRWRLAIPAGTNIPPGVPTPITATMDGPSNAPPHSFRWTFGTPQTGVTTFTSTGLTATATLPPGGLGDVPVTIEMLRSSDGKVIAKGTTSVTVTAPKQAWRMTTLAQVAEVGSVNPDDPGAFWGGGPDGLLYGSLYTRHRTVMQPLLTTPAE